MARLFLVIFMATLTSSMFAQDIVLPVWTKENIPFSNGQFDDPEINEKGYPINVQWPEMFVYQPDPILATGTVVIICPGGGYWVEAIQHEGHDIAKWLNDQGVTAVVLKYRLPTAKNLTSKSEAPLADVQRAIRTVRSKSAEWGIKKNKIGIMGFSAGGHLASTAGTHYDNGNSTAKDVIERESCRPDFQILIYPVISFSEEYEHEGSRKALIGDDPSEKQKLYYSAEKNVTKDTPPAFLLSTSDDPISSLNALELYKAMKNMEVKCELHIYEEGGHGYGLGRGEMAVNSWPLRCREWMIGQGLIY
ncbi:MAG: alpha/beta hydrolase [Cyclobacteriaceae bacterium]